MSWLSGTASLLLVCAFGHARQYSDVPFVPTPQATVDAMLELAAPKPGDFLVDLGSGDGRIPIAAAKKYGIRALGVELDPDLVRQSEQNARDAGVADKVKFIRGDLFQQDLKEASIVTVFLTPAINLRLRPKLLKELKPGARVVSRRFNMGSWKPDKTEKAGGETLYLWVVKP